MRMKIAAIGFFIVLILILISFAVIKLVRIIKYNNTSSESQELAEKTRKTSAPSEWKIDRVLGSNNKKEHDIQYMREAGVTKEEIPYTEIIYNTGDGYGGKLITYNSQNNQFYYHPYMWHIDDSQEFEEPVPCSPEQAVSIIANSNHDSKSKIPAIKRISKISGIDVTGIIKKQRTKYYLFEDSNKIVKQEDYLWYERDRKNHQWIIANYLMGHYFDAAYAVEEIDYDEETEQIIPKINCRK